MTGLLFGHPEWLSPLAAGLVALALATGLAIARGRRRLRAVQGDAPSPRRAALRDAAPLLALLAIAIGLLGPRAGERVIQLSTSGVDVVLLLDVSRSMDARDVPPSRLDAARAAAGRVLDALGDGDRAALAAFAGRGLLLTPLSPDRDALREMLPAIETSLVRPGGSDVGAGVAAALGAFDRDDARPRAVLVISDGEVDAAGRAATGGVAAARADTRVFAVAIGTERGATVPDHGVALRDDDGRVVTSRRRTAPLAGLAAQTGGRLHVADEWGGFDVDALEGELRRPVAAVPGELAPHRVTVPLVLPFAAAAFALLCCEWLVGRRPAARGAISRARRGAAAGVLALAAATLVGADDAASESDAVALLRTGAAAADRGEWTRAEHAFLAAAARAGAPGVAAAALHDAGVAALERGDLEAARDAFFDALAADGAAPPSARRARTQWNLEWVLARIAAREADASRAAPEREAPAEPEAPPDDAPADAPDAAPRDADAEPGGGEVAPSADRDTARPERGAEREDEREAERGRPGPSARTGDGTPGAVAIALDDDARRRWLGRVADDPGRALRAAAYDAGAARTGRDGGPTW